MYRDVGSWIISQNFLHLDFVPFLRYVIRFGACNYTFNKIFFIYSTKKNFISPSILIMNHLIQIPKSTPLYHYIYSYIHVSEEILLDQKIMIIIPWPLIIWVQFWMEFSSPRSKYVLHIFFFQKLSYLCWEGGSISEDDSWLH